MYGYNMNMERKVGGVCLASSVFWHARSIGRGVLMSLSEAVCDANGSCEMLMELWDDGIVGWYAGCCESEKLGRRVHGSRTMTSWCHDGDRLQAS